MSLLGARGNFLFPTKEDKRVVLTKSTVYELNEKVFTCLSKDCIKGIFTRDWKFTLKI